MKKVDVLAFRPDPQDSSPLSHLTSFSEELMRRGYTPSSQWLHRGIVAAKADDVVMAYEVSVLPQHVVPDPLAVQGSLYAYLTDQRKAPVRALQHIRALNASARLVEPLGVPDRQAVLFITRIGYVESGQAVELTHSYCRSDHCDFVAEMRRDA